MIAMRMRKNDRVYALNLFAQHLLTKIRSGIDDEALIVNLNMDSGAQTFVTVIERSTDFTCATNNWYTLRSTGAQKCDVHVRNKVLGNNFTAVIFRRQLTETTPDAVCGSFL